MTRRVGADVGGTFTDVVVSGADGSVAFAKVVSTPPAYEHAVVEAVRAIGGADEVVHGTTLATNAVLERRGARTAVVATEGFRDVLELRRMRLEQGAPVEIRALRVVSLGPEREARSLPTPCNTLLQGTRAADFGDGFVETPGDGEADQAVGGERRLDDEEVRRVAAADVAVVGNGGEWPIVVERYGLVAAEVAT